jgi:hypothetical protein
MLSYGEPPLRRDRFGIDRVLLEDPVEKYSALLGVRP